MITTFGLLENKHSQGLIDNQLTMETINHRIAFKQFIKSVLFYNVDGADIDLNKNDKINLLGHLKILDLNPHHNDMQKSLLIYPRNALFGID